MEDKFMRPIRSFVLRQGRLTKGQETAIDKLWPVFGLESGNTILDFPVLFGNCADVVLEIGFGDGVSLAQMAADNPHKNYIGIEVHRPGVGHLLHLIQQNNLSNVRVMNDDAVSIIKKQIPQESLNRVQLFFPDPWHKKRHNKRRIVQKEFVALVSSKLQSKGVFHLATDWQPYAEHMAETMNANSAFISLAENSFIKKPDERPMTKFERRGIKLGHGVWDLLYQKV